MARISRRQRCCGRECELGGGNAQDREEVVGSLEGLEVGEREPKAMDLAVGAARTVVAIRAEIGVAADDPAELPTQCSPGPGQAAERVPQAPTIRS